jgi:hypothetical protein
MFEEGRAIAHAVSRRVRSQAGLCGICKGESGIGGRFRPCTSVSPANFYSTKYSVLIYHPGLGQ